MNIQEYIYIHMCDNDLIDISGQKKLLSLIEYEVLHPTYDDNIDKLRSFSLGGRNSYGNDYYPISLFISSATFWHCPDSSDNSLDYDLCHKQRDDVILLYDQSIDKPMPIGNYLLSRINKTDIELILRLQLNRHAPLYRPNIYRGVLGIGDKLYLDIVKSCPDGDLYYSSYKHRIENVVASLHFSIK